MSMNPRETTEKIKEDYREYIASILHVKDQQITKLANEVVTTTEFTKGPYLEITLPFQEGASLKTLAEGEGLISTEFSKMGSGVHYADWKLRIHQEDALRHIITKDRNMIVSTGTGSGKTECYLYPVFNSIMREKEQGKLDAGVRALLIFPMNALANDQQKKLRKLLKDYPDITFGRYTGETESKRDKETAAQAEKRLHEEYDLAHANDTDESQRKSIPNELMSREMMAENPPHLLLTNYAMLEYMLLRPDTAPFFDNGSAKNWRFIIIDEAHTYKGANGTEIAFLLRRLKERISHNMTGSFRCIATSATLGSNDAKASLAEFAQNLFGEPFDADDVITTKRFLRERPTDGRLFAPEDYIRLKEQAADLEEEERGAFLYNELVNDLRLFDVYSALRNKPKRIEDVAQTVFEDIPVGKEQALIDLIELAAAAKKSEFESALLPARYHLFVKSLEGMFVQYYPRKKVYLDRKETVRDGERAYPVFELANCQKCEQEYLVGKTVTRGDGNYFVQTSSSDKPEYYFVSDRSEQDLDDFDEDDSIEESDKLSSLEKFKLCLCCGKITPYAEKHPKSCCNNADPKKTVTVYNLKYRGKDSEANCCPCCGALQKGLIKRFLTANQPATFAVAKSLYDAIPPRPVKASKQDDDPFDDIFDDDLFGSDEENTHEDAGDNSALIDESGRKLLIFSDNRQEAAFFAGFFEKKYRLIMWRKVILQCLRDADDHKLVIPDLIGRVMRYADKAGLYSFDLESKTEMTDDQKKEMAACYVMQEFLNPDIRTGLEGLGYIMIAPKPLQIKDGAVTIAGMTGSNLWNLLRYMMDTLRAKGAVSYPDNLRATNDFFAPRNHAAYFRQIGSSSSASSGYTYGFVPQDHTKNKRLSIIQKLHKGEELPAEELDALSRKELKEVYSLLTKLTKQGYISDTVDSTKGTVYHLNYAKWYFSYVQPDSKLYRCKKCGKVFTYSINDLCPEMKCDGTLEEITAAEIQHTAYYNGLFADGKVIPMVSREHTAQLSSRTAGAYQKSFEEGKINVLSCSTTFEMGVDVGELEATFLRNVPPETSNYIQRAGRAGRRTSSAAFSVTFSRRNSHDMTFFHDPAQIIAGKITAPVLEIENEKIAERHLNSIIVSWFFRKKRVYFDEKSKRIVAYKQARNMADDLRALLDEHPQELLDSIHAVMPDAVCEALDVDNWKFIDSITGEEGSLTRAIAERCADIAGLKSFSETLRAGDGAGNQVKSLGKAFAAEKLVKTLEDEPSISFLSAKGVLPKYGFPIDSVSLDILSGNSEEAKKVELSRDLKMAISEFAPPAKIVADSKVWQSYAINTIPNKSWPTYIYHECPKCKRIDPPSETMVDVLADLSMAAKKNCNRCGTLMNPHKFIIPVFGFSTQMDEKPKPVGESKPSAYYSTQTQFWGINDLTEMQKAEAKTRTIAIKGKEIEITYSPGGKLFVLNRGTNGTGIRVCPSCGFATGQGTLLKGNKHQNKYHKDCSNKSLVTVSLGHRFSTDILKIKLPEHRIQLDLQDCGAEKDQELSILFAILEGASSSLGINRSDISGCIGEYNELILFDDTAGGSGFVKNIFNNFENVLRAARAKVSGICGCTEETSCYGCLRNYSNQFYHDSIARGLALKYIDWLFEGEARPPVKPPVAPQPEEKLGLKHVDFDTSALMPAPDAQYQIQELLSSSDDSDDIAGLERILTAIGDEEVEHPYTDESILLAEATVWPALIWPKAHVVVFSESTKSQYDIMKKYDWYCYLLNNTISADALTSHIKKGG